MYAILDIKGLLKHMYYRGSDPDSKLLANDRKVNTAEFGFSNWLDEYLLNILKTTAPINIIAVWDGGTNYRQALYPAYKAKRKEGAKDRDPIEVGEFNRLEDYAKAALASLGAVSIRVEGVEADDVIALICQGLGDVPKIIHTVDADLLQLENMQTEGTTAVTLKNMPHTGEYQGTPTHLLALQKSLVGDSSDEYGGVPRIGPAAWKSLMETYGVDGLEEIEKCLKTGDFSAIEECIEADPGNSKVLKHAYSHLDDWQLCYKLAILHPEICYGFENKELIKPVIYTRIPNRSRLLRVLSNAGREDLMPQFERFMPTTSLVTKDNLDGILEFMDQHLGSSPWVSFDYETYDPVKHAPFNEAKPDQYQGDFVDVLSQEITGCSFNFGDNCQHTVYLSINHKDTRNVDKDILKDIFDECISLGKELVAHNSAFEDQITRQGLGYDLSKGRLTDTRIMASYANEEDESGLKMLSKTYLNYAQTTYEETLQAAGAADMSECSGKQVMEYGCDDSLVTAHLYKLQQLITRMEGSYDFIKTYEDFVVFPLNHGFDTGVKIDYEALDRLAKDDRETIDSGMARIRELLAKFCTEENPKAVQAYVDAEEDNLKAKMRHEKGYGSSTLRARIEENRLNWLEATKYHDYVEELKEVNFVGTAKQLMTVAEKLEVDVEALPLTSAAKTRVNEWITKIKETYEVAGEEIEKFLDVLGPAASFLNRRSGPEYEALVEYGKAILADGAKIVKSGDELNFNSPKQNQELMYLKLGLPVRIRTLPKRGSVRDTLGLSGSPGTDETAVETAIAEDCQNDPWKREVLETVLAVKAAMTRFSLYYNPYPLWAHPKDGVIHPGIKNCGTATRRPSGTSPNVLQISKGVTRTIVIPRYNDHVIISPDFSGQELRIAGSEAKDPVLIEAYTGGGFREDEWGIQHPIVKDVHSVTACSFANTIWLRDMPDGVLPPGAEGMTSSEVMDYELFMALRDPKSEVYRNSDGLSDEMVQKMVKLVGTCRQMAKAVNFLIIYVGQPSTLARNLRIPEAFAERIMDSVFRAYPRLAPWQAEVIKFGRNYGYVQTAYGNRKHLTADIRSNDNGLRSRMERQAVNSVVQGTAADILKIVLADAHKTKLFQETGSSLIAPVYDEIAASVPAKNAFEFCERLQDTMNITPPGHAIPMLAEVKIGKNWGEMHELGDRPSEATIAALLKQII